MRGQLRADSGTVDARPTFDEQAERLALESKMEGWRDGFDLEDEADEARFRGMLLALIRSESGFTEECRRKAYLARRARVCWDADREAEVHAVFSKLHRDPARWRSELLKSAHGCRRMISEWELLKAAVAEKGGLDPKQKARALDLFGFSTLFRGLTTWVEDSPAEIIEVIDDQLDQLGRMLEGLAEIDELERQAAEQGLSLVGDKHLWASRREQFANDRRFESLYKQLKRAPRPSTAEPNPKPIASRSITELPPASPTADFPTLDAEHEPIKIVGNRRERKRRAALIRKQEKQRGTVA